MATITNISKNNKSLSNIDIADITWDEATMTWDEAERPWLAVGKPITKIAKNNKSLTNITEN